MAERFITCGHTKFEGKWVPIFYESVYDCGLVAIANILSLHGELPGGPHQIGVYSVDQLMTFVATKLSDAVEDMTIDEAKGRLAPLTRNIEINVNFRRIEELDFRERDIFSKLGIPVYHAWKVVPEVHVEPEVFPVDILETVALDSTISPKESDFIRNTYLETECTTYGYYALTGALQDARSGICVFYWNSRFYTLYKEDDRLFLVSKMGEWVRFDMRKNSLPGPSLGRRQFMVVCSGMIDSIFMRVMQGIRAQGDFLSHIDMQFDHYSSLDLVLQCVKLEYHFDMIVINYDNFNASQVAKEKVFNWLGKLRCAGFLGVVIAIMWCDDREFEQWVDDELYTQVGISGIRYVRGDCLEEREDFRGSWYLYLRRQFGGER